MFRKFYGIGTHKDLKFKEQHKKFIENKTKIIFWRPLLSVCKDQNIFGS